MVFNRRPFRCSTFHKMGSEEPGVVNTTPIPYAVYSGSFRIKVGTRSYSSLKERTWVATDIF